MKIFKWYIVFMSILMIVFAGIEIGKNKKKSIVINCKQHYDGTLDFTAEGYTIIYKDGK